MTFKNRKKAPREDAGDLSVKKHIVSGIRVDEGECGDHYCDGHQSFWAKCTCGFVTRVPDHDTQPVILAHRLAVIEWHLGLSVTEDDDE